MNLRLLFCVGSIAGMFASVALAQPALERVEQQLRHQSPQRTPEAEAPAGKQPGYLGVIADDRRDVGKGVRVMEAVPTGPAAKGGLKPGDLITSIDDTPVKSLDDMTSLLSGRHAGELVKFSVDRNGTAQDLDVRLEPRPSPERRQLPEFGRQPEDMPAPGSRAGGPTPGAGGPAFVPGDSVILGTRRPKLGVKTVPLTQFMREQARLPGSYVAGVYVTYVDPDAPAGKAGLSAGAIVVAVDGEPIDTPDALKTIIDRAGPGQILNMTYYFHDHESQANVTLAGGAARPAPPVPNPQMTTRAKPLPAPSVAVPAQPPGFSPDEPSGDTAPANSGPPVTLPAAAPPRSEAEIQALEQRIAELEKRVAELEAATTPPTPPAAESDK